MNEIGFNGLLKVKSGKMPSGIIPFLIVHFDHLNRVQNMPNKRGYIINDYDDYVKTLGFSNPNSMKAKHIIELFLKYPNGGDDFQKLYVLNAISILLALLPNFRIRKAV